MVSKAVIRRLRDEIGLDRVVASGDDVDGYRHDYWVLSHLVSWQGTYTDRPGAVVRPRSTADVQATMRLASETGTPVVPFGLGSGVCGGIRPDTSALLIDMSAMDRVRRIDTTNQVAFFDAGVNGLVAEEAVAEQGLTIGHWPQSIAVSSVGGWISTRAAGQFSTAYGGVEDMVHSIEVVLPDGDMVVLGKAPRAAAGPDLRHLFIGAEGTMGIVTGVALALHRQPEQREFRVYHTPSLAAGLEVQRQILQTGWLPPVMRQYDVRETRRTFRQWSTDAHGMLLMVHEGPAGRVAAETEAADALAGQGGLVRADDDVAAHWMQNRNHVVAWDEFFEQGLIVDTIEIAASWSAIEAVYDDVIAEVGAVDGVASISAHSSHAYRTGVNLYFSFAARADDPTGLEAAYLECWHRVMEATARHGGGIAHHHGIGRIRRPYLVHDLGETGVTLLRTVHGAIDPKGLMNPGNLIPDA